MATRLHLNGVNYDLAHEPGGISSASRTMTDGMKTRKEFYLQVKTRQGDQITLTVNPEAVFAWAVYEWDPGLRVSSGAPDNASELAAQL